MITSSPNQPRYPFDERFYTALLLRQPFRRVETYVVPPGTGFAFRVDSGQTFRLTMLEGAQCIDLCMMNAHDPSEHFASGAQTAIEGGIITRFTRIWGTPPASRSLATCIANTVRPRGDALYLSDHVSYGGHCSPHEWMLNYKRPHRSCYDNLRDGMAMLGLDQHFIHDNMNLFQKTALDSSSGEIILAQSNAEPGDYLEFYAELDLAIVLSLCPYGDLSVLPPQLESANDVPVYPVEIGVYETDAQPQPWSLRQAGAQ